MQIATCGKEEKIIQQMKKAVYPPAMSRIITETKKKGRDLRALGTCIKLLSPNSNTVLEGTHWITATCSFSFNYYHKTKSHSVSSLCHDIKYLSHQYKSGSRVPKPGRQ